MDSRILTDKITKQHTEKLAYLYVRQSSRRQTERNTGSTDVQKEMYKYAVAYGFAPENIVLVLQDQGHSAALPNRRVAFRQMLKDVARRKVGAIICSHTSRLARTSGDNYHLVLACEMTGTLIIEKESVFNVRVENDRLYLGFRGLLDEADGRRITAMMMDAKLEKAKKGELRLFLPTGLLWSDTGKIILDPNEQVQHAIRDAFALFEQLGSALSVVRHFREQGRTFPTLIKSGPRKGKYEWRPLSEPRLIEIYHNPAYAGSYVFGRYESRREVEVEDGFEIKQRLVKLEMDEWAVHIPNFHQGYISWEQFLLNQQKLSDNRAYVSADSPGAVREGSALLTGIIFCGKCKYRMQINYPKGRDYYFYDCQVPYSLYGAKHRCQTVSGLCIDGAVSEALLQAFQPAQLEMTIEAEKQIEIKSQEAGKWLELSLKEATQAAEYAKYRYDQVDPQNRNVAEAVEKDLEAKLEEVKRLKRKREELITTSPSLPSPSQRKAILALAQHIPDVWNSDRMTPKVRKQLLRPAIKQVFVDRTESNVDIQIVWQTGARTLVNRTVPTAGHYTRTKPEILDLVRQLAVDHTDREIAAHLNDLGLKSAHGKPFNLGIVESIRTHHDIPTQFPEDPYSRKTGVVMERRADGRYSTLGASKLLRATPKQVSDWCKKGILDAFRYTRTGSWWVNVRPEDIELRNRGGRFTTPVS
jgi:DNA invertase Pin-like site-specific DNA recombinase